MDDSLAETLEDVENLQPEKYLRVLQSLDQDGRWLTLTSSLKTLGLFCDYQMNHMRLSPSPSSVLLNELKARMCTFQAFKSMLRSADILETLSLLTDSEPLQIVEQPAGDPSCIHHDGVTEKCQHVPIDGNLFLSCKAVGLPRPSYQWYCDNMLLDGCTQGTLKIANFTLENEGEYFCEISHSDEYGVKKIVSDSVICKMMHELPTFVDNLPSNLMLDSKSSLSLSVMVSCLSPYSLQWYKGFTELRNETGNTLLRKNVTPADSGEYRCLASNEAGELWSTAAIVEVKADLILPPTTKLALLIANSIYDNFDTLRTPGSDIMLLATKLKELNFEVIALFNLTGAVMEKAIDRFFELLPPGSYGVFCFIGHGFKYSAFNYMMATDCESWGDGVKVVSPAICDEVLVQKGNAAEVSLILIMDMCLKEFHSSSVQAVKPREQFNYEPSNKSHFIKLYSTGPYQRAYEDPYQPNGFFISHISKYIFDDETIILSAAKARESFFESQLANYQTPHFTVQGGPSMKLTTPAKELRIWINQSQSPQPIMVNFHRLDVEIVLTATAHGGHIINVIDIIPPPLPSSWMITYHIPEQFENPGKNPPLCATLINLQHAKESIFIQMDLHIHCSDDQCCEDTCDTATVELPLPFIAKLLSGGK